MIIIVIPEPTFGETLRQYMWVTASYWWLLLLGVIMPFLDLVNWHLPKEIRFKPWVRLLIAFLCLSAAQFLAYRNSQHNLYTVIDEKSQFLMANNGLQARLDALTRPQLIPTIDSVFWAPEGADDSETLATVNLTVINKGASTILSHWRAVLKLANGRTVEGRMLTPPAPGKYDVLYFGANNSSSKELFEQDHIAIEAGTKPIDHGGAAAGWIQFWFPVSKKVIEQATVAVSFNDFNGDVGSVDQQVPAATEFAAPLGPEDLRQEPHDRIRRQSPQ